MTGFFVVLYILLHVCCLVWQVLAREQSIQERYGVDAAHVSMNIYLYLTLFFYIKVGLVHFYTSFVRKI